jgi:hypothetical protein
LKVAPRHEELLHRHRVIEFLDESDSTSPAVRFQSSFKKNVVLLIRAVAFGVGAASEVEKEANGFVDRNRVSSRCYERVDWLCGLAPSKPEVTNPARFTPLFRTGRAVKDTALLELQFAGRYDWATAIKVPGIVFRQLRIVDSEVR